MNFFDININLFTLPESFKKFEDFCIDQLNLKNINKLRISYSEGANLFKISAP